MEAMQKLKDGQRFNEVASAYSEDKARQGVSFPALQCCNRDTAYMRNYTVCYIYYCHSILQCAVGQ